MITCIIGASTNPSRYSFLAANMLSEYGHTYVLVGNKLGILNGIDISMSIPEIEIDTISMYISPKNQIGFYHDILNRRPRRVIFNPGTENPELEKMLFDANVKVVQGCTLVMLRTNQY